VSVACPWISTSCVGLAASGVRWRIEPGQAFREQVEHFSDAERLVLADAYQALLRDRPLPHPSSPLVVHRFRDPRAGRLCAGAADGRGRRPGARHQHRGPSSRHHPPPVAAWIAQRDPFATPCRTTRSPTAGSPRPRSRNRRVLRNALDRSEGVVVSRVDRGRVEAASRWPRCLAVAGS
jgi:hypothetical protein